MKPYDETVGQVIWALSEESGHIASIFSNISDPPPIEWLEVFESEGFLKLANNYNSVNDGPPLVDQGFRSVCPESLNPITRNIAIWLAQHLDKKELLDWVIKSGSCVHPEFRDFTRRKLSKKTLPKPLKVIWQTINSESYSSACFNRLLSFNLLSEIKLTEWGPILREQVLWLLKPKPIFGAPWREPMLFEEDETIEPDHEQDFSYYVDLRIKLRSDDHTFTFVERLKKSINHSEILADLAFGVTGLVKDVYDIKRTFGKADEIQDLSYIRIPSISNHQQNHRFAEWTKLIELQRDSWQELCLAIPNNAKALVEVWKTINYPIFRRFVIYAMAESDLFSAKESLDYLLSDNSWWLWSIETQREKYRLLNVIW